MERIKKVGKATKFGNVLREQNCERRGIDNDLVKGLQSFYCTVEKFTIVELIFNKKRYHGISVKSDQDKQNLTEGIARAYLRAFDEMVEAEALEYKEEIRYGRYVGYLDVGLNNVSKAIRDEVCIYNRALSQEETTALYNSLTGDACCRMSTCVGPAPDIEIGTISAEPIYARELREGIYRIKCLKCGEDDDYFIGSITPETRCPACKRKLLEGPR